MKTGRRKDVTTRIGRSTEAGGIVDNAEFDEAKNEQAFLEGRISDLEKILANAVVAPKSKDNTNSVQFGSSFTVATKEGKKTKCTIAGSVEAAPWRVKFPQNHL